MKPLIPRQQPAGSPRSVHRPAVSAQWVPPSGFRPPSSGFTLLELSIVMLVIIVMLGFAIFSFQGLDDEQRLRQPATELESLLRTAINRSRLHLVDHSLYFDETGIGTVSLKRNESEPASAWRQRITLPPGVKALARRSGSTRWIETDGLVWPVRSGGFCEPWQIRFETASSHLEATFDPLSGVITDESMIVAAP